MNTNTAEVVKDKFEIGWMNLPAHAQTKLRDAIVKECGWKSLMTFYTKKKGTSKIGVLEIKVIEAEFKKYGINPWTGMPFFDENY